MSEHGRYQIVAVKEIGDAGEEMTTACDDDDPDKFGFGLYIRDHNGLAEWISDHETRKLAEDAMAEHQKENEAIL